MTYIKKTAFVDFINTIDTSASSQVVSNSLAVYDGSEFTYTPPSNASHVIIEILNQFTYAPDNTDSFNNSRLQESTNNGATWSDISGTSIFSGNDNAGNGYETWFSLWTIMISPWSGSKKFRIRGRSQDLNSEFTYGRSFGVGGYSDTINSPPQISIYSKV